MFPFNSVTDFDQKFIKHCQTKYQITKCEPNIQLVIGFQKHIQPQNNSAMTEKRLRESSIQTQIKNASHFTAFRNLHISNFKTFKSIKIPKPIRFEHPFGGIF